MLTKAPYIGPPIVFDAELNEYHIKNVGKDRGYTMIYYCPMCGGAAPPSKRDSFFATVTRREEQRLRDLTTGLLTVEKVIKKLGKPDDDMPVGAATRTAGSDVEPPKIKSNRTLVYRGLSRTAEVHFTDYGPDGGLRFGQCSRGNLLGDRRSDPAPSSLGGRALLR